jgi:ubiquinone/menaquinone biosynthesis C-methylase UbiE
MAPVNVLVREDCEMPLGHYFAAAADSQDELARLRLLEDQCDPDTHRYLDAVGVGPGWRCLEVGAGAGALVRWLSDRVGPTGRVVAADINPKYLGDLSEANVEVRRCDITVDDLEPESYDLVHSRFLLMHLDDPAEALRRMLAALRPGGWLVAEEPDNDVAGSVDFAHPLSLVFDKCYRKRVEFASAATITDLRFGKVLPLYIEACGLTEIANEGVARVFHGGDPFSRMWIKTWQRIDDAVIASGILTEAEVAEMRRAYEEPTFTYRAQLTQAVWGRKPR